MPRRSESLVLFLSVAGGYALGAEVAFAWFGAGGSASFFPAAGVTLAALVLVERRRWPLALAAAALAEVAVDLRHDIDLTPALGYAVANTAQPLVGALLLVTVCSSCSRSARRSLMRSSTPTTTRSRVAWRSRSPRTGTTSS